MGHRLRIGSIITSKSRALSGPRMPGPKLIETLGGKLRMFSKKIVALVLFVMLMPMIAACGTTPESTATPQAAAPATEAPTAAATEAPQPAATNTAAPSGGTGGAAGSVFRWR